MPQLAEDCIRSWKRFCEGYELVEWNETTFDINAAPEYVKQAYAAKKWAFVTDYVRLYALYTCGGIYMDTDVEVLKPLDPFLELNGFSGFEQESSVPTGIMASEKGHELVREWLEEYDSKCFLLPDGTLNQETNVEAITRKMKALGLELNNSLQTVCRFTFYPKDYFCPKSYEDWKIYKTKNTYTIHHFAGSWKTDEEREAHQKNAKAVRKDKRRRKVKNLIKKIIGEKMYNRVKARIKK